MDLCQRFRYLCMLNLAVFRHCREDATHEEGTSDTETLSRSALILVGGAGKTVCSKFGKCRSRLWRCRAIASKHEFTGREEQREVYKWTQKHHLYLIGLAHTLNLGFGGSLYRVSIPRASAGTYFVHALIIFFTWISFYLLSYSHIPQWRPL